jgi:hypothetical protein
MILKVIPETKQFNFIWAIMPIIQCNTDWRSVIVQSSYLDWPNTSFHRYYTNQSMDYYTIHIGITCFRMTHCFIF